VISFYAITKLLQSVKGDRAFWRSRVERNQNTAVLCLLPIIFETTYAAQCQAQGEEFWSEIFLDSILISIACDRIPLFDIIFARIASNLSELYEL
jgi:hypothetical protein